MRTLCRTHLGPGTRDPREMAPGGHKPERKFTFTPTQVDRGVATTSVSPVNTSHIVPAIPSPTESSSVTLNYSQSRKMKGSEGQVPTLSSSSSSWSPKETKRQDL